MYLCLHICRSPSLTSQPGEQDDILSVWAPDIHAGVKPSFALRQLGIATLGFCSFFSVVYYFAADSPAERRVSPTEEQR